MLGGECIEEVLEAVGCGRRTVPLFVMLALANMVQVHFIISALVSVTLPFRCHTSASLNLDDVAYLVPVSLSPDPEIDAILSISDAKGMTQQHFFDSKCLEPEPLLRNENSSAFQPRVPPSLHATGMASCPYIQYDQSQYTSTLVSKFHLVCEQESLLPLFHIMATIGGILSGVLAEPLGDIFGRLKCLRIGAVLGVPVHVVLAYMPWYPGVLVLRVFVAICSRCIMSAAISIAMESIPARRRPPVGIFMGIPYCSMVVGMATFGYFLREWRYLHLVSGLANYVILPLTFMVEESPRWLVQKGHGSRAAEQLRRDANINNVVLPPHLIAILDKLPMIEHGTASKEEANTQALPQLKNLQQFLNFLNSIVILMGLCLLWFLSSLIYFCVMLNSSSFSSDSVELYVGLANILQGVAMLISMFVTQRVGRRLVLGGCPFVCGILLVANLLVPLDLQWMRWLVTMSAIFIISSSFQVLYLYTTEVFPTVIRSRGLGIGCGFSFLGSALAALLVDLLDKTVWWGTGMVMAITGTTIALLVYFLPETNNVQLPDTLQDLQGMINRKKLEPPSSSEKV